MGKENLTINQTIASNPKNNVWVQANAGTGKTKVLVHRLLQILFKGEKFGSILCLTYTTAGAEEMKSRILAKLSEWNSLDDNKLKEVLSGIIDEPRAITDDDLVKARRLFYDFIDTREPIKIQTIHSFCQDILTRFPIEAGINSGFKILNDSDKFRLLNSCFYYLFKINDDEDLIWAWNRILEVETENNFSKIQENVLSLYEKFFDYSDKTNIVEYFSKNLIDFLHLTELDEDKIKEDFVNNSDFNLIEMLADTVLVNKFSDTTKKRVQFWKLYSKTKDIKDYAQAFVKTSSMDLLSLSVPARLSDLKYLEDIWTKEAERFNEVRQKLYNLNIYLNTRALLVILKYFISIYKEKKQANNVLDYDDLILYTRKLFSNPETMGWVLNQLDSNLQYILVDEAQDTSPIQWDIIKPLISEFYNCANTLNKSVFVVGDLKQSIFSFQGADPKVFKTTETEVESHLKNNLIDLIKLNLDESFRTVKPILDFVDIVFNNRDVPYPMDKTIQFNHKTHRIGDAGDVVILPYIQSEKEETDCNFKTDNANTSVYAKYCDMLADKIEDLINNQKLISQDRKIEPSDIMILVRKRHPLTNLLINSLKAKNIPVNGSDRIKLSDHIAIQDLISIMQMTINLYDDYNLACVLKSPLFDFSEQDLFKLSYNREADLIDRVQLLYPEVYKKIILIQHNLQNLNIYDSLMYLLDVVGLKTKFLSRLGISAYDPINEFLNLAISFDTTEFGSIYQFISWFNNGQNEIKRDMEKSEGVRILTVHGSKGLEAPIVFLTDTMFSVSKESGAKFIDDKTLLWFPVKEEQTDLVYNAQEKLKLSSIEEYYRLLYVAMTRAKDRLYISGCGNAKTTSNQFKTSWYGMCMYSACSCSKFEKVYDPITYKYSTEDVLMFSSKQTNPVETKKNNTEIQKDENLDISLSFNNCSLALNEFENLDINNFVKSVENEKLSFDNGTKIHKLFELNKFETEYPNIVKKYAWIFDNKGLNERVFINKLESGFEIIRIDRLVFVNNEVHIIDYKTDDNPKIFHDDYVIKMKKYISILQKVYSNKKVFAHLLWLNTETLEDIK